MDAKVAERPGMQDLSVEKDWEVLFCAKRVKIDREALAAAAAAEARDPDGSEKLRSAARKAFVLGGED